MPDFTCSAYQTMQGGRSAEPAELLSGSWAFALGALSLRGRWMRMICKFLSCTMYNLIQPGFLPALILKLACDWLSWVFPCLSNIPFQFGHIVLLGDSGPDNCMSQPFCAVWQYTGLLFFQLFGQCSCFCGLKSTSRILQSLSCSGVVPTKHCRCIWWALSQRTEHIPACTWFSFAFTISYFSSILEAKGHPATDYRLSHIYQMWDSAVSLTLPLFLLFLSMTRLVSCACKFFFLPPPPPLCSRKGGCPRRGESVAHECWCP